MAFDQLAYWPILELWYAPRVNERSLFEMKTTCQICGRVIQAKKGVIAHHGYNRPGHGWQTASCHGARFLPYEVSRDRIPQVEEIYRAIREAKQTAFDAMMASPPATLTIRRKRDAWDKVGEPVTLERPEGFDAARNIAAGSYRPRTYESEHAFTARQLKAEIASIGDALAFLAERFASWPGAINA